jgi:hypothetical protein
MRHPIHISQPNGRTYTAILKACVVVALHGILLSPPAAAQTTTTPAAATPAAATPAAATPAAATPATTKPAAKKSATTTPASTTGGGLGPSSGSDKSASVTDTGSTEFQTWDWFFEQGTGEQVTGDPGGGADTTLVLAPPQPVSPIK